MAGLVAQIGYVAVIAFIITSMAEMGLSVTFRDLAAPMRNRRLVTRSLLANFVLVPLFAFAILLVFPMSHEMAAGLIMVSIAAGAPSTPKVAEFSGGNISYAVSLTILLTVLTIILMPLALPLLLAGVSMNPARVAFNLVVFMLIPIIAGILVRNRFENRAEWLYSKLFFISNACIGVVFLTFGLIFLSRLGELFGSTAGPGLVLVSVIFTIGALAIGYLLGGPGTENRGVLAFGTGFRNITAVLVVITASYSDLGNDTVLIVLMITIFSVIIVSALVGIIFWKNTKAGA